MSRKKIFSAPAALIVVMITALFFGGISVSADDTPRSGTFGENLLNWSLDDEGVLTISGTGAMPDYQEGQAPWYSVRADIKSVVIGDGVTSVGSYAFIDCSAITTLELGEDVEVIGNHAFQSCSGLTTVTFDDNLTTIDSFAFRWCYKLSAVTFSDNSKLTYIGDYSFLKDYSITSLKLPSGVTYLGLYAFEECKSLTELDLTFDSNPEVKSLVFGYCTSLESVKLSGNITSVGSSMFSSCSSLITVDLCSNITNIGSNAFSYSGLETITLPDSVKTLGDYAFYECKKLNSVNKPAALTAVGDYAFAHTALESATLYAGITYEDGVYQKCPDLSDVTIENGVTAITAHMFADCGSLESVTIPNTVTSLRKSCFSHSGLKSVTVPSSVKSIGVEAFYSCTSLTSYTLNEGLESIGDYAFASCNNLTAVSVPGTVTKIGSNVFSGATSVTEVTLNLNSGTTVGEKMFLGAYNIAKVTITGTVTDLGDHAFDGCSGLKSITLPSGLTRIGTGMFTNCTQLTTVEIPSGVKFIGDDAFVNCSGITEMVIPSGVTYIGSRAFSGNSITAIAIPDSVETIGEGAFGSCRSLASVTLSNKLTEIKSNTFKFCTSLKDIEIPASVELIDANAFEGSGLTSVDIPGNVSMISGYAFDSCAGLKIVTMKEGVENIGAYAFANCSALESVYIPASVDPEDLSDAAFDECISLSVISCTADVKEKLIVVFPEATYILIDASGYTEATVVGHSITLSADIGLNFYVYLPQEYDINNTEVTFTWGGNDNAHNVKCSLVPSDLHGANYKVTCNVAAKEMTDTITMVITSGDDELVSDQYSVVKYMNILVKAYPTDGNLNRLLMAMALYGTYSQQYFNYNTDFTPLVNSGANLFQGRDTYRKEIESYMNGLDKITVDPENLTIMNIEQSDLGLKFYGASVICTSQTKMRFYFEITDQSKYEAVTASCGSQDLQFIRRTVNGKSLVYLETPGLSAGALENAIVINIGGVDFTYDYLYYVQRCSADFDRFAYAAKAIYAYSYYARIYEEGN